VALDDNAAQSQKYTSSGTIQLLLKVCAARLHPQPEPGQLGIQMQYRSLRTSALSTTLVVSVTFGKTAPRFYFHSHQDAWFHGASDTIRTCDAVKSLFRLKISLIFEIFSLLSSLALQLLFRTPSESMGNHDSTIVDAGGVN
jgi:hypothetical protein